MKVTETVWKLAEPIVAAQGCTVWDVEYVREGAERFLRLYIDKDGGVDISDCEAISRALSPSLWQTAAQTLRSSCSLSAMLISSQPIPFPQDQGVYITLGLTLLLTARAQQEDYLASEESSNPDSFNISVFWPSFSLPKTKGD